MKHLKKILFFIMAILMLTAISSYAAEPELQISGETEAKPGEAKTLTVKIVAEENMGVLAGKIVGDQNISNIEISGKNGWSVLAQNAGSFNLVKAEGGKNEDVLDIKYTVKEEATEKATITFSSMELTTLEYQTKDLADITKEIKIVAESEPVSLSSITITKVPNKVKYTAGEKFNAAGMEITAKYSDGTSKVVTNYTYTPNGSLTVNDKEIVISYTENSVTKTVKQSITVEKKAEEQQQEQQQQQQEQQQQQQQQQQSPVAIQSSKTDNTVANKELSKAGIGNFVFYATMVVAAIGSIFYVKYTKMKDVK